jgi:tetratricopeptide (TPR) repeat protein
MRTLVLLAVLFFTASPSFANGWPKTLVTAPQGVVYAERSTASAVRVRLTHAAMVQVRKTDGDWSDVVVALPGGNGRTIDAWMRTADLLQSPGMAAFWNQRFDDAVTQLDQEVRATKDAAIARWLRFYLGYAQWATGRLDLARETFSALARGGPPRTYAAPAFVALSRVAGITGDLQGALAAYRDLLAAVPELRQSDYRCVAAVDPYPASWEGGRALCEGSGRIQHRIDALERLIGARADGVRLMTDPAATPLQRAGASLAIGRAWEAKNAADPGRTSEGFRRDQSDARAHYDAAIATAPGTAPAGHAAWQLIPMSAPYEWEGDWQAQAAWTVEKYGAFLKSYPDHELAGEARFEIAMARWAQAGYPEVYRLILVPESPPWPAFKKRQAELDAWFEAAKFGGGHGATVAQHVLQLPPVVDELRAIVADHPKTPSAPMAQYWIAVILDYGLDRPADARVEYQKFLKTSPKLEPYATKAQRRLAAVAGR